MKIQTRFLIMLVLVFTAVAGILVIQRSFELQRSHQVLNSELSQRKALFKYYLGSEGKPFQTFSEDYSFWDDMVTFVKTGNMQFAHENLDSGLSTFGADADWVYRPNGTQLYKSVADPSITIGSLPFAPDFFKKLTAAKFLHFYIQTPGGMLEVRAATIVPGDDPDHNDPPAGFWVIGRYLGKDFISNIQNLSQSSVRFEPPNTSPADSITNNSVAFVNRLDDWQGRTVGLLSSSSHISVISDLNNIYRRELVLLAIISFILIATISIAIWRLVLEPIHLIARSIQKQQPTLLNQLGKSKSQLGDLANTVQLFYKQKLVIQEDQFRKAELERLNSEKTTFLALAAHELKGPITVAKMLSAELMETFRGTQYTSQLFSKLDIITDQITKMVVLINDLQLASEGKENDAFTKTVINFDGFIQKEIAGAYIITRQKLVFEGSTGKQVYADPDRLGQVVSNLIRNASKYSPGSDKIIIRSLAMQQDVVFEVEDFGIGISPEDQKHIFERYYRAPSVSNTFQGLGLGLSICKNIIDHMGGKIWVESSPGHGTHACFSLPIYTPPRDPMKPLNRGTY